ncbi:IS5 family transposase [Streptomyces sporangiiformans]|uniref:IS5 family transposase n=1 Tax=Streptomyces sporangiiformans TaxID=2315329 RepID=UPI0013C4CCEF
MPTARRRSGRRRGGWGRGFRTQVRGHGEGGLVEGGQGGEGELVGGAAQAGRGRGGQPEAYCHRAILDAIRYLVDNGIERRAMPADFPPWDRVYAFFRRWRDHRMVKEFPDRLRAEVRGELGRDAEPSAGVIDSQSVKADAVVGSDSRGFDGGKLINGRKRHVVVDTLGLLLGVVVTAADTGDRAAAQVLLEQVADAHHRLALVWADGGYTGSSAYEALDDLLAQLVAVEVLMPRRRLTTAAGTSAVKSRIAAERLGKDRMPSRLSRAARVTRLRCWPGRIPGKSHGASSWPMWPSRRRSAAICWTRPPTQRRRTLRQPAQRVPRSRDSMRQDRRNTPRGSAICCCSEGWLSG